MFVTFPKAFESHSNIWTSFIPLIRRFGAMVDFEHYGTSFGFLSWKHYHGLALCVSVGVFWWLFCLHFLRWDSLSILTCGKEGTCVLNLVLLCPGLWPELCLLSFYCCLKLTRHRERVRLTDVGVCLLSPAHIVLITARCSQGTTLQGNSQTGWNRPFGSSDSLTCLTAAFSLVFLGYHGLWSQPEHATKSAWGLFSGRFGVGPRCLQLKTKLFSRGEGGAAQGLIPPTSSQLDPTQLRKWIFFPTRNWPPSQLAEPPVLCVVVTGLPKSAEATLAPWVHCPPCSSTSVTWPLGSPFPHSLGSLMLPWGFLGKHGCVSTLGSYNQATYSSFFSV